MEKNSNCKIINIIGQLRRKWLLDVFAAMSYYLQTCHVFVPVEHRDFFIHV